MQTQWRYGSIIVVICMIDSMLKGALADGLIHSIPSYHRRVTWTIVRWTIVWWTLMNTPTQLWVEMIAQCIAYEVKGENGECNCQTRVDDQPPLGSELIGQDTA